MLTAAPISIRPTAAALAARVDRISVAIASADPLSRAGLAAHLRDQAGIVVVPESAAEAAAVMVVVADDVDEETTRELRGLRAAGHERLVLLVAKVDDAGLLAAVEAGVSGVVRRSQATAGHLATAIRAAAVGEGTLPPTSWAGSSPRSGACSARCSTRAASPSRASRSGRSPSSGCLPRATTPPRSAAGSTSPSGP